MSAVGKLADDQRWKSVQSALAHEQARADEAEAARDVGEAPEPRAAEPMPGRTCRR